MARRIARDLEDLIARTTFDVIVTASQRLSRAVHEAIATRHTARGDAAWRTPKVMPWASWLQAQFMQAALTDPNGNVAAWQLLDSFQVASVWRGIVASELTDSDTAVFGLAALSREVSRAFSMLCRWQISEDQLAECVQDDESRFLWRCLRAYREQQAVQHWLTIDEVSLHVDLTATAAGQRILFAGFTEPYPSQHAVIAGLGTSASVWVPAVPDHPTSTSSMRPASDDALLVAAGDWARQCLQADPSAQLAIVLPALSEHRQAAVNGILRGLYPNLAHERGQIAADALSVSLGQSLDQYPAMHVVLSLLAFASRGGRFDEVSQLLRSPLLGSSADSVDVELALRRLPDRQWRWQTLLRWVNDQPFTPPVWLSALAEEEGLDDRTQQSPADWAAVFSRVLTASRWLENIEIDSTVFQLRDAIYQALNRLADLSRISPRLSLKDAVDALARAAGDTIFQPEQAESPVLLAGPLETIGLAFDGLFLGGRDHQSWPPQAKASSLIPWSLQRRFGMPDSSADQVYRFWQSQLARNLASADSVCVAVAATRDEMPLIPSVMLSTVLAGSREASVSEPAAFAPAALPNASSNTLRPLPADRRVVSGHQVLTDTANNPLLAVIAHRWQARQLDQPEIGINPAQRGTLLHLALELLLRPYVGMPLGDALRKMDHSAVEQAVRQAFRRYFSASDGLLRHLLRLEEQRAAALIGAFVRETAYDAQATIGGLEVKTTLQLGDLQLSLRIDRIDRRQQGVAILDYKSGQIPSRPRLPQLLDRYQQLVVYALASESLGAVHEVALFSIGYNAYRYYVWQDETGDEWSGEAAVCQVDEFATTLRECRTTLVRIAEAYCAGDLRANRNPRQPRYSEFLPVTRLSVESAYD